MRFLWRIAVGLGRLAGRALLGPLPPARAPLTLRRRVARRLRRLRRWVTAIGCAACIIAGWRTVTSWRERGRKERAPDDALLSLRDGKAYVRVGSGPLGDGWLLLEPRSPEGWPVRIQAGASEARLGAGRLLLRLEQPARWQDGEWWVAGIDDQLHLRPLLEPMPLAAGRKARIVVDPSHGGSDPGASGMGLVEKHVTLDLAQRLVRWLGYIGLDARLTREVDAALSLGERAVRAGAWEATLFVSIHCNDAPSASARGVEIYLRPAPEQVDPRAGSGARDQESLWAAAFILGRLVRDVGVVDRGIRRGDLQVLREAPCACLLIECGFLSHPEEAVQLGRAEYRLRLAAAMAQGLRDAEELRQRLSGSGGDRERRGGQEHR